MTLPKKGMLIVDLIPHILATGTKNVSVVPLVTSKLGAFIANGYVINSLEIIYLSITQLKSQLLQTSYCRRP